MNKNKDIEEIFKKAFENFEANPGANAWEAVKSNIGSSAAASGSATAGTSAVAGASSWVVTAVIAVVLSAAIIGGYFYFDSKSENIKTAKFKNETTKTEVEQSTPAAKSKAEGNTNFDGSETNVNSPKTIVKNVSPIIKEKERETTKADNSSTTAQKPTDEDLTIVEDSEPIIESKGTDSSEDLANNSDDIEQKGNQSTKASEGNTVEKGNVSSSENQEDPKSSGKSSTNNNSSSGSTAPNVDTVQAPIFDIPNVFSPNQDGINDRWIIKVSDFDNITINVFNKTNELVYQHKAAHLNDFWNGKLANGNNAPEGVYIYQIIVEKEGKYFKDLGSVSLKR